MRAGMANGADRDPGRPIVQALARLDALAVRQKAVLFDLWWEHVVTNHAAAVLRGLLPAATPAEAGEPGSNQEPDAKPRDEQPPGDS